MKTSKLFGLGGLALVALLLFIFSFLLVHNESEDGRGGEAVSKHRSLKLGKGAASPVHARLSSVPHLFSLPMFQSLAGPGAKHVEKAAQDDYYYYARDDDDEGGGEGEKGGEEGEEREQEGAEEGEQGNNVRAAAAAMKEKRASFLDRVILSGLRAKAPAVAAAAAAAAAAVSGHPATSASASASASAPASGSGSKLQSVLLHQQAGSAAGRSLMHPAAPDPALDAQSQALVLPQPRFGAQQPLRCRASYEPTCPMYKYVRFWNRRFFPEDCYSSPMRHALGAEAPVSELKYLVFEPDRGGWNNIRMAAETAMIFAHATGRVLVMPPKARMYLLDKDQHQEDNESTFSKFFDLSKLAESVTIISMEQFLGTVAAKGLLAQPLPSGWTPQRLAESVGRGSDRLWKYLETACYVREWEPGKIHLGFNLTRNARGEPVFGRIDLSDPRVKRHASHARKLVPYDAQMHHHKAIYFPGDYRNTHRILTHFYSYLYWADAHTEHIYKRLVRDRLHYHDDIFCAAGRVVRMLHEDAAALSGGRFAAPGAANVHPLTLGGDTNRDATYFAYHIRRGDFQYHHTKISAEQIWAHTKHLLAPFMNRTSLIYIATDEKDKSFFEPFHRGFAQHNFKLVFIADYVKRAFLSDGHLNQNHIGMVEQVICANAHTFIGTPLSTFTGYITRMRGYYRDGRYARTYYTMPDDQYQLHKRPELVGPFWAREFAVAHREIDDFLPGPGVPNRGDEGAAGGKSAAAAAGSRRRGKSPRASSKV